MNIIIKIILIVSCFSLAFIGCGGGELKLGTSLDSGTDTVDDGGTTGSITQVTLSDELGVEIGDTIAPTKAIVATFDAPMSDLNVTMVCDGEEIDLSVVPLSDTEVSIMPQRGRYPQLAECVLRMGVTAQSAAKVAVSAGDVFFEKTLTVLCDVTDDFGDPRTIDRDAESFVYGKGCWKVNYVDVSPDRYRILDDGNLWIDAATGPEEFEFPKYPLIFKRISGDNYSVQLDIAYVERFFQMNGEAVESIQVMIFMGDKVEGLFIQPFELEGFYFVSYEIKWDKVELTYKVTTNTLPGYSDSEAPTYVSYDEFVPSIGFIKEGAIVTPYYILDGKKYFFNVGGNSRSFDLSGVFTNTGEVDVGIVVTSRKEQKLVDVFLDSFAITGAADFVQ